MSSNEITAALNNEDSANLELMDTSLAKSSPDNAKSVGVRSGGDNSLIAEPIGMQQSGMKTTGADPADMQLNKLQSSDLERPDLKPAQTVSGGVDAQMAGLGVPADQAKKPAAKKKARAKKKAAAGGKAALGKKAPIGKRKAAAKKRRKPAAVKNLQKVNISDEVMIRFTHVTKTFNLYKNDFGRFLGLFGINREGQFLGSVNANDDLSFEIKKGEAVAFLGLNGAGKSTALKMITGVMYPTSGIVEVNGRVSALLELKAGFDSKLTGRENIHLRGQILGFTRDEIDALMPGIEEFADLGLYFDQPMKSYSSGMRSRLGFAFAVATNPEILVVDEALSVGDKAFRRKCLRRIREIMMDESVTVLFVTHSSRTAQQFCSRGIVLEKGSKIFEGTIEEATAYYEDLYGD